jgi:hypothetical protein
MILKISKLSNGYRFLGYLASSLLRKGLQEANRVTVAEFKMAIRFRISKTTEIDGSKLGRFESSVKTYEPSVPAGVDIGGYAGAATRQERQSWNNSNNSFCDILKRF